MKGNVVLAASILALGLVMASVVAVLGVSRIADRTAARLEEAARQHGKQVERAGAAAGTPIRDALVQVDQSIDGHAGSIEQAGAAISRAQPSIEMRGSLNLGSPVQVQGPRENGALPVDARIAK